MLEGLRPVSVKSVLLSLIVLARIHFANGQDIWAWEVNMYEGTGVYKVVGGNENEIFSPSASKPEEIIVVGSSLDPIVIGDPSGGIDEFCWGGDVNERGIGLQWKVYINVQPFSNPSLLPNNVCEGDHLDLSIINQGYEGHNYSLWVSRDVVSWELVSEQFMEIVNPQKDFRFDFSEAYLMNLFGYSDPELAYGTYWFKAEATTCRPGSVESYLWNSTKLLKRAPAKEIRHIERICLGEPTEIKAIWAEPVVGDLVTVSVSGDSFVENQQKTIENSSDSFEFNLSEGEYTVLVERFGGCQNEPLSIFVKDPPTLAYSLNESSPSCWGNNDGLVRIEIESGVPPYSYRINGGLTNIQSEPLFTINHLTSGRYTIEVEDLCTSLSSIAEIQEGPSFETNIHDLINPTCNNDGAITVGTTYSGMQSIQYKLTDSLDNQTIQSETYFGNLFAGKYTLSTIINDFCQFDIDATLKSLPDVKMGVSHAGQICSDGDGFMILTTNDRNFDITYELSGDFYMNGSLTDADFVDGEIVIPVPPGLYDLIIDNSCKNQRIHNGPFGIVPMLPVTLSHIDDRLISCADGLSNRIDISVENGTEPYSVSIEGHTITDLGLGDYQISPLGLGDYTIRVEDDCGNTSSQQFSVAVANGVSNVTLDAFEIISPISCANTRDASIHSKVSGGSVFSGGGKNYEVKLIDLNEDEFYPTNSHGNRDEFYFFDLGPGTYFLTILDNNDCEKSFIDRSVEIDDPSPLVIEPISVFNFGNNQVKYHDTYFNIKCSGELVDYRPDYHGGTGEYSFLLQGGTLEQPLTHAKPYRNLGPGTYTFTVKDENECETSALFTLVDPQPLNISLGATVYSNLRNISCVGNEDGQITAIVSGGVPPYDYSINSNGSFPILDRYEGTWAFSNLLVSLPSETFQVTVTDFLGCEIQRNITLEVPSTPTAEYEIISETAEGFQIPCKGDLATIRFRATGGDGVNPYRLIIDNEVSAFFQTEDSSIVYDFMPGIHEIKIADELGCQSEIIRLDLNEPNEVLSLSISSKSPDCIGGSNGQVFVSAFGGVSPYQYKIDDLPWQGESIFNNLETGNYEIIVADANSCEVKSSAIVSPNPEPLTLELLNKNPPSCHHGTNGSITVRAYNFTLGAENLLRYFISGGHYGTEIVKFEVEVDPLAPDHLMNFDDLWDTKDPEFMENHYKIWVEDVNQCEQLVFQYLGGSELALIAPEELVIDTEITSPSCLDGNNGWISIRAYGGVSPYYFSIDNVRFYPSNTSDISTYIFDEIPAGHYEVFVRDSNFDPDESTCLGKSDVDVADGFEMLVASQVQNVSCAGGDDGAIALNLEGSYQQSFYDFEDERLELEWFDRTGFVSEDDELFNLSKGNYSLQISYDQDTAVCQQQTEYIVYGPSDNLTFSEVKTFPSACGSDDLGRAIIDFQGGWPDSLTYYKLDDLSWQPALSTSIFIDQLRVGSHSIQVAQSDFRCVDQTEFLINNSKIEIDTLFLQPPRCSDGNGGRIVLSAKNATDPIFRILDSSYVSKSGVIEDLQINMLYRFLAIDESNSLCHSDTISFFFPECDDDTDDLRITGVPVIQPSTCKLAADGVAKIFANGGLPPYRYFLNGKEQSDGHITGLSEGYHQVIAIDQLNKKDTSNLYVSSLPDLAITTISTSKSTCAGKCYGTANVDLEGGSGDYVIHWSDGFSGSAHFNLCPGIYEFQVRDSRNEACELTGQVSILEHEQHTISEILVTPPTCFGNEDGRIEVRASGGSGSYSYEWGNGVRGPTLTGLSSGAYPVTLTDKLLNCTFTDTILLSDPPQISISDTLVFSPTCENGTDGSIRLTISNASSPLVQWDDGEFGLFRRNLKSGNYRYSIISTSSCEISGEVNVPVKESLNVSVDQADNSCFEFCEGNIELSISGGQPSYSIVWENGQRGVQRSNLCSGIYRYEIVDRLGCPIEGSIEIGSPDPLGIDLIEIENVSCHGLSDGKLQIEGKGGIGPYTFEWSNGQYEQEINQLSAGSYSATLSDQNGCTVAETFEILQPRPLFSSQEVISDPSCHGMADGSIEVFAGGGVAKYQYSWSNTISSNSIENLSSGTYQLRIEDENGCSLERSYELKSPAPLQLVNVSTADPMCFDESTGQVKVDAIGGTKSYSYQWSSGHETPIIESLLAGNYDLTVTDQNGCRVSSSFLLSNPDQLELKGIEAYTLLCDGSSLIVSPDGVWERYLWEGPSGYYSVANSIEVSRDGVYQLTVANEDGCAVSKTFEIEISDSNLRADFIRISEPAINEPLIFLDLSIPVPDEVEWILPDAEHVVVNAVGDDFVEVIFNKPGDYEIGLKTSYQNCYAEKFKIIAVGGNTDEDLINSRTTTHELVSITVFPNPAKDQMNIAVKAGSKDPMTLALYNMSNEKIIEKSLVGKLSYLIQWDLPEIPSGVYLLTLQSGKDLQQQRILVMR